MIVHLIGNIAAGKTTLLNQAKPHLADDVTVRHIDEMRDSAEDDAAIWHYIDSLATSSAKVIFEHTGRSVHAQEHFKRFSSQVILLSTPRDVCYNRWLARESAKGRISPEFRDHTLRQISGLYFYLSEFNLDQVIFADESMLPVADFIKFLPKGWTK